MAAADAHKTPVNPGPVALFLCIAPISYCVDSIGVGIARGYSSRFCLTDKGAYQKTFSCPPSPHGPGPCHTVLSTQSGKAQCGHAAFHKACHCFGNAYRHASERCIVQYKDCYSLQSDPPQQTPPGHAECSECL